MSGVESSFAIVAEPNRRAILSLLLSSDRSVGEIERELHLSQPSVSRVIAALEKDIGVALVARTTRAVTLTDVSKDYLTRVDDAWPRWKRPTTQPVDGASCTARCALAGPRAVACARSCR